MKKINQANQELLDPVLQSADCMSCRDCCKFGDNDCFDSPMFTENEKKVILKKFHDVRFVKVGKLWKVVLVDISGKKAVAKYICPFYNSQEHKCLIYSIRPFDCSTWPFYIMKSHGKVMITLSKDCPVVLSNKLDYLLKFAEESVAPYMIKRAIKYPDLVTPYHNDAIILLDVTDRLKKSK